MEGNIEDIYISLYLYHHYYLMQSHMQHIKVLINNQRWLKEIVGNLFQEGY